MAFQWETMASLVLAVLAFIGSYYSFLAYSRYKGDIMQTFFAFMSVAFIFGLALDSLLAIISLVASEEVMEQILFPGLILCIGLIMAGMIPVIRRVSDSIGD